MARGTWGGALEPNIFKVNFRFLLGTSHCQTGFKLRDVGVQDNTAQEVADEVATQLGAAFRAMLTVNDSLEMIDVLRIGTEEGGVHIYGAGTGTGTQSGTAAIRVPNFICANVAMKSEIRKRYGQGRMFLPMPSDDSVDGNVLTVAGTAFLNAFLTPLGDHFMGDPVTHDLLLVNAHPLLPQRLAPGAPGYRAEIPATWYDVVSLRINNVVTFLRSRKQGVGS